MIIAERLETPREESQPSVLLSLSLGGDSNVYLTAQCSFEFETLENGLCMVCKCQIT